MMATLHNEWRVWRVVIFGLFAALFLTADLSAYRWYRDLMGLSPFYDVRITQQVVDVPNRRVIASGTMRIRECQKQGHVAYTIHDGIARVADFDPSKEAADTPADRPALSENAQYWGPWIITARHPNPESALFVTVHMCWLSGEPRIWSNTFIEIPFPKRNPT